MCKRQAGEKLGEEEKGLEGVIDDISEDHAKLVLDRLELLSKLREIAKNPKLDERIKLCENNLDTPDWWEPGKHDRELIRAVLKYGLYRSDQYILNDPDFPFCDAERKYLRSLEALKAMKLESPADLFKLTGVDLLGAAQEPVKTENVTVKKEEPIEKPVVDIEIPAAEKPSEEIQEKETKVVEEETKPQSQPDEPEENKVSTESVKDENLEETPPKSPQEKPVSAEVESNGEKEEKKPEVPEETSEPENGTEADKTTVEESMEVDVEPPKPTEDKPQEPEEPVEKMEVDEVKTEIKLDEEKIEEESVKPAEIVEDLVPEIQEKSDVEIKEVKEETEVKNEPEKVIDTVVIDDDETPAPKKDSVAKQAADLKARFPDLEVFQPLMKLKQLDSLILKGDTKDSLKSLSRVFDTSMVVKWFRDFALEKRVSHIIYCVEKGEWPVGKSYSAYTGCLGIDLDLPLFETVKRITGMENDPKRSASSTPDIITITTDNHQHQKPMTSSQLQAQLSSQLHQSLTSNPALSITSNNGKKQKPPKRHIAIDVETERAKLHALLNNQNPLSSIKAPWNNNDEDGVDVSRRSSNSGPIPPAHQPPPAHQHQSSNRSNMQSYHKPTVIPGTSSTLTPIDLSAR